MLSLLSLSAAFSPPCSSAVGRRELFAQGAAAALAMPAFAALADGANSAATVEKARSIYGSRVFRLQTASAEGIVADANAITLFISGSYRGAQNKDVKKSLTALQKKIVASAKAGDESGAKASLKEFIALAKIGKEQDLVEGGNFNPKQRRNAGAPPTSEIEAQMGTEAYALYTALPVK